ncbi:MAG TPA: hypothetical protein VKE93_04110 [Candidatus Angelobacter sp.]|nr:hypothetical protein [Candidatus Angelobacter sp.]
MLTLTNSMNIEGYTIFQDDGNPVSSPGSRAPKVPFKYYVLPNKPDIAKDDKGKRQFSLIVYRQDERRISPDATNKDMGGGILTFTVELGVPDADLKKITSKLREVTFGESAADPTQDVFVDLVPFLDGTVSVAVAGESTGDASNEFVKNAVGTGKVSGIGNNRKAVMVKLTQEGASLMSQLEKVRTLPINVQYDLTFEHRLLGVTMHVWCDITSSYTLIQEVFHDKGEESSGLFGWNKNEVRTDKVTSVTETLARNKTLGVEVVPGTSQVTPDTITSLQKMGMDMVNKEIEKAIEASPPSKDMDRTYLTQYLSTVSNSLNFTMDSKMVLVQNFRPSSNISNIFQEGRLEDMVAFIDLRDGFFNFLKVPVRVNADFKTLPLDSVTVTVVYNREKFGGGDREQVRQSFNFKDGSAIQTFLAYANTLAEITYDWDAVVHYRGSDQTFSMSQSRVKDDFLVVDVGTLGMIQVDLGLGLVNLDSFPAANISFRYNSESLNKTIEAEFKLDKTEQTALWAEPVHENPSKGYEYKVDWLRKDGEIMPGKWTKSTASRLRLDAPVPEQLKVSVMCSGNFKDGGDQLSQIGVSLRYSDPDNHYTQEGELVFTDDKVMQSWTVDLRNPDLRAYQYRYDMVYRDGLVKQIPEDGGWLDGQPGFITVGEHYLIKVDVFPALLTYSDNSKMVQVDFSYSDPDNNIDVHDSLIFSSQDSSKKTWRVRGVPGSPKNYTYQIRYYSSTGAVTAPPPVTQAAEVIVVPPLPIATPAKV